MIFCEFCVCDGHLCGIPIEMTTRENLEKNSLVCVAGHGISVLLTSQNGSKSQYRGREAGGVWWCVRFR